MKQMLRAMGICIVEKAGLEADDILGTIAKRGEREGMEVALVSGVFKILCPSINTSFCLI